MKKDLKKILGSDNTEEKRQAVDALKESADKADIPFLIEAMKDQSWRVRKTATGILKQQFEVDQYIDGVISLLYIEDNAGARNSAIDMLVSLGKTVIPDLLKAFETDNHDVRKFVIDVIGEISDDRALPLLLTALKDEDENVKASAVEHLGKLKEPSVVDALIEILGGDDLWIAYPAADALGRIGDRKAIAPLISSLENKTLREPSLRALGCFAEPDTLDSIIPLLMTGSRSVKEEVLRTVNRFYKKGVDEDIIVGKLSNYLGDEAFDVLLKFAWSNKADIRLSAILMLGIMKDPKAVQPLLDMTSEEEFRDEIKKALVFIGRASPDFIMGLFDTLNIFQRRFIVDVAVETGRVEFSGRFEELLGDDDGHVRGSAATGLAKLGDPSKAALIRPLLKDGYMDVQEAAVDALVLLKEGIKTDDLISGLSDDDVRIRRNCCLILGNINAIEALSSIGFLVKDADVSVRRSAVRSLSMIRDPENIRYLKVALTDERSDIRIEAAYALGAIGDSVAIDDLILLLLDSDEAVRVAAAKALGVVPDKKALKPLMRSLGDDNGFVVAASIEAIGKIGSEDAREALLPMLESEDEEIKRTAISALAGYDGVEERMIGFLKDEDWATRKIAVEVLGKKMTPEIRDSLEMMLEDEKDPTVQYSIKEALNADK
ncbi:MAG: HEAT repeat domain-containing protein [Nitrospirota bacterium]|nr:MAG: HEAT repeat domain-containing protein [Nitrospirota bacterium]